MKYKHRFLQDHEYADTEQAPNVFHFFGTKEIEGVKHIGVIQEGTVDQTPTWWEPETFEANFEALPA